jgi:peroxiredoxin
MSSTTTTLASELQGVKDHFINNGPPAIVSAITTTNENFAATFDYTSTIKVGDKLPSFTLTDAFNKEVRSAELLAQGPLLLTFYRGEWCPYCNLALRALQKHLPQIQAKGVTLVAISPELPDQALTTTEKNELKFTVLSDVGNKFAAKLGILFQQPDAMRSVFKAFGTDFEKRNGDDSLVVPVPATLLVDQSGTVRNAYIETDYSQRLEPSVALEWIEKL